MAEVAQCVQCVNCTMNLLSENAYMRGGKPFCDEWCADHFQEFDTEQNSEIVCPFCGHEFDESYEFIGDDMVECDACTKRFELETEELVYYTTRKPDWLRLWREYNSEQIYRANWRLANEVI